MLKMQGETLPADAFEIVDAKEEKQKRKVKDSLVVLPSTVQKGRVLKFNKKRAKNVNSDDSEDDVVIVNLKDPKKVIQ